MQRRPGLWLRQPGQTIQHIYHLVHAASLLTASRDLAEGRSGDALKSYQDRGFVTETADTSQAIARLVEDYMADLEVHGAKSSRLAHRRKDVHAINQIIRSARKSSGDLSNETLFRTNFGPRAFAAGDRMLFTRNERDLGVKNGLLGTVETIGDKQLMIRLDGQDKSSSLITISPQRYTAFDHGYATTIHKSQGATTERAFILGSTTMDRHLTDVAHTRHRNEAHIYGNQRTLRKLNQNQKPKHTRRQPNRYRRNRGPTMH